MRRKAGWRRICDSEQATTPRVAAHSAGSLRYSGTPMGQVVKLEKPGTGKQSTGRKTRRREPARSRTALVLGGGGVTGGVYEIGALRALDLLAVNRTVNQFDVYVGTSAGS